MAWCSGSPTCLLDWTSGVQVLAGGARHKKMNSPRVVTLFSDQECGPKLGEEWLRNIIPIHCREHPKPIAFGTTVSHYADPSHILHGLELFKAIALAAMVHHTSGWTIGPEFVSCKVLILRNRTTGECLPWVQYSVVVNLLGVRIGIKSIRGTIRRSKTQH